MPIEGVIAHHLDHLRVWNLRQTTIYSRQRVLARITAWANGPILYLTERDLSRWQSTRSREIGPESLRSEMSGTREFYHWCIREHFRDDDPTARLDLPRVRRRPRTPSLKALGSRPRSSASPRSLARVRVKSRGWPGPRSASATAARSRSGSLTGRVDTAGSCRSRWRWPSFWRRSPIGVARSCDPAWRGPVTFSRGL